MLVYEELVPRKASSKSFGGGCNARNMNSDSSWTSSMDSAPNADGSSTWILRSHEEWTSATVNAFFREAQSGNQEQINRWMSNKLVVLKQYLNMAQRVEMLLQTKLSVVRVIVEDMRWLQAECRLRRIEPVTDLSLRYGCRTTLEALREITVDVEAATGLAFIWGYSLASLQGFRLCQSKQEPVQTDFDRVAAFVARDDAVLACIDLQELLDRLLAVKDPDVVRRAYRGFHHAVSAVATEVNEVVLVVGDSRIGRGGNCEKCGRHGHDATRCTFRNHVLSNGIGTECELQIS
eukprot:Plantae.Rhodophyta-Rhodochaete_pulchella.ctg12731.p1 GENE.Plantae.Rhodophyta-Rhodochaete_pulchella.ctg12731~~Plantae.Rhodophyta-Rhodochaete_pulchella.ctg12731.p1  ORF type:complete len:292 (-),score=40.29 Plantae.Rhodophyta-Rhodochaete_pulchella.ctg12731:746-1621(-)